MPQAPRDPSPLRYGFLMIPELTMLPFTSSIEPLRMANDLTGRQHYLWTLLSADGRPVMASNGMVVNPHCSMAEAPRLDALFVCAGKNAREHTDREVLNWLRRVAHQRVTLGGVCTGSYLLAKAGLLNGYRCTIHWEWIAGLREEFPALVISSEIFEIDRDRYSCAGGVSPLDMMLNLIGHRHGSKLAAHISEELICDRIRERNERQRIPLRLRLGTSQPKLVEAVMLMEANIEEPMGPDEIASHVGLSRRQLERLFQKYLNCVPTRYYLELRLTRARQLLQQTNMSIVDVAFACGFVSAPHFSKCYRDLFNTSPRDERRRKVAAPPAAEANPPVAEASPPAAEANPPQAADAPATEPKLAEGAGEDA